MSETGTTTQAVDAPAEEHVAPDGVMSEGSNVRERLLMPIMIPVLVVVIVAFVAINTSRIFLATAGWVAVGIATALMVGIMAIAAWLSANERLRSSTASVMAVAAVFVLLAAGLTTLGAAEGDDEGGVEALPVDSTITVDAGNFFLIPKPEISPPGVLEFTYVNTEAGLHTLLIEEDPSFPTLTIDGLDDADVGKTQLESGTYTLFCDIPGHREAGMETTITIEEGAPTVGGDESGGTGAEGTPEDQPVEG